MTALFCFGLGYSAQAFARRMARRDWRVMGSSTTESGAHRIATLGYDAFVFDGTRPGAGIAEALAEATHVLVSVPPGAQGDPVLAHHGGDLARTAGIQWIGYLSTIGVYGDWQGAWVDETSPPCPVSERSKRRLVADEAWLDFARRGGKRVEVFRLAGIYGPGRSAIDNIRNGTARRVVKPGQVFNRIHVEDIASVLEAAVAVDAGHAIYNVADDEPAPPEDVITFAAELLGLPVPPAMAFETADLSPMARSFYAENKRVRNARIKQSLGVELRFPTYREGLRAIAERLG